MRERTAKGLLTLPYRQRPNPPTITVLLVAGLANPDFLVEIDAIAAVPEG
jgi:enamine deaminase RidA (YjgF/YER057c/UK114 family)